MVLKNIFYDISYKWERRHKIPYIGPLLGKKLTKKKSTNKTFYEEVLNQARHIESTGNCIDDSKINSLLAADVLTQAQRKSLNLLFYWGLWHLVMAGEIKVNNCPKWLAENQRLCENPHPVLHVTD
ncbi:hypothetical protein DO021_21420 [Desulfobacter hydrogenophilus]|nr:hypothetical protein DO021_21420 [Desulfobacter hydrogenophilus]